MTYELELMRLRASLMEQRDELVEKIMAHPELVRFTDALGRNAVKRIAIDRAEHIIVERMLKEVRNLEIN